MRVKLLRIDLKFKFFLFSLVIIFLFLYLFLYLRWKKFKEENEKLLGRIKKLDNEVVRLEKELKSLQRKPYLLEKIARNKLGLIKEGEIVVDIRD